MILTIMLRTLGMARFMMALWTGMLSRTYILFSFIISFSSPN